MLVLGPEFAFRFIDMVLGLAIILPSREKTFRFAVGWKPRMRKMVEPNLGQSYKKMRIYFSEFKCIIPDKIKQQRLVQNFALCNMRIFSNDDKEEALDALFQKGGTSIIHKRNLQKLTNKRQ